MAVKENIWPGDTYTARVRCCKPDENDENNSECIPETPVAATAKLFNRQTTTFVDLGGDPEDDFAVPAIIEGSRVKFTVGSDFTQEPGRYMIMLTVTYADENKLTSDRQFSVLEYR